MSAKEVDDRIYLSVEGQKFLCSKSKLVSHSGYFEAMFSSRNSFVESELNEIFLKDVDVKSLAYIMEFVNNDCQLCLSEDNALQVLSTASMLQFTQAQECCTNFLLQIVSIQNCLEISSVAECLNLKKLEKRAKTLALWEFTEVCVSPAFFEMDSRSLKDYLQHPNLNVNSEYQVFEALSSWIIHSPGRTSDFYDLLTSVLYFATIDTDELRTMTLISCVIQCQEVSNLIVKMIAVKTGKLNDADVSTLFHRKRCPIQIPCVVGCITENMDDETAKDLTNVHEKINRTTPVVFSFNSTTQSLDVLLTLEKMKQGPVMASGFKVNSNGKYLYITGGEYKLGRSSWNCSVWRCDTVEMEWSLITSMEQERRNHGMCFATSDLYLVGGFQKYRMITDRVTCFNLKTCRWTKLPNMPVRAYSVGTCIFKDALLVFSDDIFAFQNGSWNKVKKVVQPTGISFKCAMPYDDVIYLTSPYSRVLYKLSLPSLHGINETIEAVYEFDHVIFNSALVGDIIYSFTQDDDCKNLFVETYNIVTSEYKVVYEGAAKGRNFCLATFPGCFALWRP